MPVISLSKSQYLKGLQCHKSLWLYRNRKDLLEKPTPAQQAIFDTGANVGVLAQELFPNGATIEFEGSSFAEKVAKTKELIESGEKTIYEATFQYDDILVMVDILHKGRSGWDFFEVKSSTEVKDVHRDDVAVQFYVLTGSEIKIKKASLIYINNKYVRKGDLDIKQLFNIENLTNSAKDRQEFVKQKLKEMRKVVGRVEPEIDIGPHCSDPYDCDFLKHCWGHIPETSVFDIGRLSRDKKWTLYDDGILKFEDLPEDYPLNPKQQIQVEAELTGKEYVDKEAVKEFLETLYFPLYFLDFETFNPAIPPFDGNWPYQQIPFQFSLHFQKRKGGKVYHEEFLAEEGKDPRKNLAKSLVEIIPNEACVLTYNSGFEKRVIKELAAQFPKLKKKLLAIQDSILDLMIPFQSKAVYKKEMNGSYSIKAVLPALIPEMSYKEMAISEGSQASSSYATLHLMEDLKERKKIRQYLLEYCKLDTLAMVNLLEELKNIVSCTS